MGTNEKTVFCYEFIDIWYKYLLESKAILSTMNESCFFSKRARAFIKRFSELPEKHTFIE